MLLCTLGLVLTDWLNPFFAELAQAVELAAAGHGRAVLMANSAEDPATERARIGDLESRQVDGLLVTSLLPHDALLAWAARRDAANPVVLLNADAPISGFLTIGPGFVEGARSAVEHLITHGHRRIAILTGSQDPQEPRERGWRLALRDAGLRPGPVGRGRFTRESGYELARRMLTSARPPTAIFAVSDLIGVGVLRAAHESGVKVGTDLAVACFDGTREAEYAWPPLTAVRQPLAAMAAAAVDAVLDPLAAAAQPHQTFPTALSVRRSCGCR